jgi:hypothetical protein
LNQFAAFYGLYGVFSSVQKVSFLFFSTAFKMGFQAHGGESPASQSVGGQ